MGDFRSLDGRFAVIVELLWVCEGPFSKNTHISHRFKRFYIAQELIADHFGSLSGHFWRMKVTLEPLWGHFGITFGMRR